MQSEKEFQTAVVEYAQLNGWMLHHDLPSLTQRGTWRTAIQGDPGFPDLAMARHGFVVLAELKSEKGRQSEAQKAWEDAIGADPADGYRLWRPSDWDEIEQTLRRTT